MGSGASGAAVTWSLSAGGFKVVCLEQGPWVPPSSYPTNSADWQYLQRTTWDYSPNVRKLPADYPVNDEHSQIKVVMYNAIGGSTIHWTAHVPRFHPSDFRVKSLDGVAEDWPISYFDLEPYYDLNDEMMGCSGINGDPANPPRSPRQMPPLPLGPDGERMARAFDSLGWHWWPSDSHVNSTEYRGRQACNYCGPIGLNCDRGARASSDITYLPDAIKLGADVRPNSTVYEITTGPDGRATGANYYNSKGEQEFQPANSVVVAGNGIGTPRMLLHSRSRIHPNGLANSSGMVGKNLMFHVYAGATGLFNDLGSPTYRGPLANIIMSQEFYETDPSRDFKRGYTFQVGRGQGPAPTAIGNVPWGKNHHVEFDQRFGKTMGLGAIGDDLPEEINRVELDTKQTDRHGIPAPKITYRVSENSKRLLAHGVKSARKVLEAAGAHRIFENPFSTNTGWHLMGTARMGDDPGRSVVDRFGQSHDADNLFIVDGSVFVTGAAVNPTPTIQALALRTADYIRHERMDLKS
ncbi:MAG: GMC family oxidoreductase [Chloroflexi bacterium]|nr:GMC family oxidoreductase [Chloroflexota bacterium]